MARLKKVDNIVFDKLRGHEKAAILINYLGAEAAKTIFKNIDDGDIRKLLGTMARYRIVPIDITKKEIGRASCRERV